MNRTIENRGTTKQMLSVSETVLMVSENSVMIDLWQKYRKKYPYATDISWEMAIDALKGLMGKALAEIN